MGVRGARETPIRLIVPVYTRAGARELPFPQWGTSYGMGGLYARGRARVTSV